jgi:hypothetical protein
MNKPDLAYILNTTSVDAFCKSGTPCLTGKIAYLFFLHHPIRLYARFDVGLSRSTTKPARPKFIFRRHGWTAIVHRWEKPIGKAGN